MSFLKPHFMHKGIKCSNCGKLNKAGSLFCNICGYALKQEESTQLAEKEPNQGFKEKDSMFENAYTFMMERKNALEQQESNSSNIANEVISPISSDSFDNEIKFNETKKLIKELPYKIPLEECTDLMEVGPRRIAKELLFLTKPQEQVLCAVFSMALDQGLMILDFHDLKACIQLAILQRKELEMNYGYMPESILKRILGAISDVENGTDNPLSTRCNPYASKFLNYNYDT